MPCLNILIQQRAPVIYPAKQALQLYLNLHILKHPSYSNQ